MVIARKVAEMQSHQTKLSPMLRSFAAVTLLAWLAAQVLCAAHCNFGVCHGEAEKASCHGPALTHHDDADPAGPGHDNSSTTATCLTLKSALVSGSPLALVPPELHLLYTLAPVALALDATMAEATAPSSRQAWRRDWAFTPEVYLGPAFRSHAPPLPRVS
jgi:hypothetical protein